MENDPFVSGNLTHWSIWNEDRESLEEELKKAQHLYSEDFMESWMTYSADEADDEFRNSLANFLSEQYGDTVKSDCLTPTFGIPFALSFLCNLLLPKKTIAFVEEKVPQRTVGLLEDLGFTVIDIPLKTDGLDMEAFENLATKHCSQGDKEVAITSIAYLTTDVQDPTGLSYSEDCRKEIISLARRHNILVICNDSLFTVSCYNENEVAPKRLFSLDDKSDADYGQGHVVSIGCFDRLLSSSFDFGWIELPLKYYKKLINSGDVLGSGTAGFYWQGYFRLLLRSKAFLKLFSQTKRKSMEKLKEAHKHLLAHLSPGSKVHLPRGGFFLWIEVPGMDSEELLRICPQSSQLSLYPGHLFTRNGDGKNTVQLNVGIINRSNLTRVLDGLIQSINVVLKGSAGV